MPNANGVTVMHLCQYHMWLSLLSLLFILNKREGSVQGKVHLRRWVKGINMGGGGGGGACMQWLLCFILIKC